MEVLEGEMQQMKLKTFCEKFDVARSTALQWIHEKDFPAYNLGGHWYVDVAKFYCWREQEHIKSYKYA